MDESTESQKYRSKLEDAERNLYIENFRCGIKSQVESFAAMDIKASIFVSTLFVVLAIIIGMLSGMDLHSYHLACRVIIYALGVMLLGLIMTNIFYGFASLKGRDTQSGMLQEENLNSLRGEQDLDKVKDEILGLAIKAYRDNQNKLGEKSQRFKGCQHLWQFSAPSSILFMLLLLVVQLVYGS